ncbi:MAG: HNH endonuclease [Moorea sp. SIO3E2]|nr:HNH endonuclease [Moorena sp. SIO3B2]NEQ09205.1 HNH endonuclease [Moorena sp. SIO4E2]NEQ13358.1 HNH endonuclease [Moorena sp. SIO3E2]NES44181.1 HNH endonuclease [Moorena sp. SIO2C4]
MRSQSVTSTTEVLRQSVVVFSKNYLPINRVNIKRAIALLVTGKAEPIDFFGGKGYKVRSPSVVILVPTHIRLIVTETEPTWRVPPVNRREVLRRDKHRCQYCGSTKKLTLDHVMPRSKGGKHSWDNVVTACERCNSLKGNRTPHQAGMKLPRQPKAPMHPAIAFAEQFWRQQQINRLEEEVTGNAETDLYRK